jgi:hypothetical protein
VSLEAGKRPQETKKTSRNPPLSTENRFKIKKLSEVPSSLQNQAPAQRFLRTNREIQAVIRVGELRRIGQIEELNPKAKAV